MIKELDQIVLTADLPKEGLKSADVGTVVKKQTAAQILNTVAATKAKATFSDVLAKAGYLGQWIIVKKEARPTAVILGYEDFQRQAGPNPSPRPGLSRAWPDLVPSFFTVHRVAGSHGRLTTSEAHVSRSHLLL
jgi:prevent-host-death family protein